MMEIEFRGKETAKNGRWIFGFYINYSKFEEGLGDSVEIVRHSIKRHDGGDIEDVIFKTVGQYTCLKDKNGVKIFGGDILRDENKTLGTVEFNKGRFVGSFYGRTYYSELYFDAEKSEVIGNIHDNPELMEA